MIAFSLNKTLVLPPFAPWVHEPAAPANLIPFAQLIDASGFVRAMERVGVRCVVPDRAQHEGIVRLKASIGWVQYKKQFALRRTVHLTIAKLHDPVVRSRIVRSEHGNWSVSEKQLLAAARVHSSASSEMDAHLQRIASAVLRAFRPSSSIRLAVDALAAKLRLPARFGCVHARIERDMARISGVAREITISDYVRAVLDVHSVTPVSSVFVASGERFPLPLRYIGPPWRQAPVKIDFDDTRAHGSNFTYLHASLIDFALCRRASWFVGFGHSSFSRILAELQHVDNDRGWTSVCPGRHDNFSSSSVSLLHVAWSLCGVNQTRPLALGSFGWFR